MVGVADGAEEKPPTVRERNQAEKLVTLLQRERADVLNERHGAAQEHGDERERAREELLKQLPPLLDDLDRARRSSSWRTRPRPCGRHSTGVT
jgi:molecular chaperone GrpE (heat shock protein)